MALKNIAIRDFVIVRELDLSLSPGFTVLTGETGAGKSILVDAMQLALGARADMGVVREGASRCEISVEFDNPAGIAGWLQEFGFDSVGSNSLLLRRTIDTQGKSRAWINGSPATATQLREIADQLVDIYGQHAWQSLTRPEAVRGLLDAYAKISTALLQQYWVQWRQAQKALLEAHQAQGSLAQERDRLAWQIGELSKLAPQPGEWEEINRQHSRLSNAQTLRTAVQTAVEALQEGEEGTKSNSVQLLGRAIAALQGILQFEPDFKDPLEVLESALAQVLDVTHTLNIYARDAELEPQRLAELDERLSLWIGLARRYKRTPAELPDVLTAWRSELQQQDQQSDLAHLAETESSARMIFEQEARALSAERKKAAPALSQAITQSMQGLGMQGGRFEVLLTVLEQPTAYGFEQAEFLVSGHSGSIPRPVGKVASGGELSRIALAIAVTTSQLGEAQTLIFDEVDSGVGGAVAETVGRMMKQLGTDRQVMAVTHLPQVAACADQHLVVAKHSDETVVPHGSTFSTVIEVCQSERVIEIARMLGGERLSNTTLAHAREMLEIST